MTVIMSANDFRRRLLKCVAILLVVATMVGLTVFVQGAAAEESTSAVATTSDDEYKELQSQYDKIEQQMSQNQEKLDQVQNDMDKQEQVVDGIGDKISDTQNQINLLLSRQQLLNSEIKNAEKQIEVISAQLDSLSGSIAATKEAIEKKQEELDVTYDLLKMRIRAMYMAGKGSNLEFLLASKDFSTLLSRTELLIRVAEHDNDLMATLETEIESLSELETTLIDSVEKQNQKKSDLADKTLSLESNKAEIQKNKDQLNLKQKELEDEMDKAEADLALLDKESDEYKAIISQQEDELIALSKQMEDFIKNNGSSTTDKPSSDDAEDKDEPKDNPYLDGTETVFSSGMIFPLKFKGVYISSPFGMRKHPTTGEYKLHTGTDFAGGGINGTTVYAVKDGEVIYAAKHKAYGNFVIVDHGNGISSCYAHMQDNSLKVKVGDKVLQGQPIGKVGSTGYSTGPHLHFEVRVNGETVDPMGGYIKLPG